MTEKISIIVPVYNTENYIDKCLESLINQTYKNVEIILVDDGSTDRSYYICNKYVEKDNRIKIIKQKTNRGQSVARNIGIDESNGAYILLVDSDDWIDLDMCEKLYNAMRRYDADIVCAKGCFEYKNKTIKLLDELKESMLDNRKDFCLNFLNRSNIFSFGTVAKLYRHEIFNTIRYPVNMYYEDIYIGLDCLLQAKKVVIGVDSVYHYRQNPNSTIRHFKEKLYYNALEAAEHNLNTIKELYPELLELARTHLFLTKVYTLDLMILNFVKNKELENVLKNDLKFHFFDLMRNSYIYKKEKIALLLMLLNNKIYRTIRYIQKKIQIKN